MDGIKQKLDDLISEIKLHNKLLQLSKEFLTISEAALYMGVSKSHIEKLTSGNKLKYTKPGNKLVFIKKEWLLEYLHNNVQPTQNEIDTLAHKINFLQ